MPHPNWFLVGFGTRTTGQPPHLHKWYEAIVPAPDFTSAVSAGQALGLNVRSCKLVDPADLQRDAVATAVEIATTLGEATLLDDQLDQGAIISTRVGSQVSATEAAAMIRAMPICSTQGDVRSRSGTLTFSFGPAGLTLTDVEDRPPHTIVERKP